MVNLIRFRVAVLGALIAVLSCAPVSSLAKDRGDRADRTGAPKTGKSFAIRYPLPFKFGERLKYEVKFSKFLISATVADLHFRVSPLNGSSQHIKFEAEAKSRGALTGLFNIDVHDMFTSLVDRDDMFVYSTIKDLQEGDYRSRREAVYDRQTRKVRVKSANPADPKEAPVTVEAETRAWVQDLVSAIYFARTRKLKNVGREVNFALSDEGQTYDIGIVLVGKEDIKVDAGTFKTLKVEARIFNGRFIQRDGTLFLWLTDDARRIPVKAQVKSANGTITFNLTDLAEGDTAITPAKPVAPSAVVNEPDEE